MSQPIPLKDAGLSKVTGGAYQQAGAGNDSVNGTAGNDILFGGGGHDSISSGAGEDQVNGEAGNDTIHAGAGSDYAYGGAGHDLINGGASADQLYGEDGDDFLDGGEGDRAADLAFGGQGADTFVWAPGDGNDQFHGGAGQDTLNVYGLSLSDLQAALRLEGNTNLQMQVRGNIITFTDPSGSPASFSGAITVGGETMRFTDIEKIRIG
ncbi:calcium-binding protein [Falsiroseomonas sp.]|uniref:calcium-binding protein n=1 Tax=Falsiroseomonas sp. TaxID=2870721 RepID=UPI003F713D3F